MIYLNEKNLLILNSVNYKINNSEGYKVNIDLYRNLNNWNNKSIFENNTFDYAIEKRKLLINHKFNEWDLKLATCWIENIYGETGKGEYHAVLIVNTNEDNYCLDNRSSDAYPSRFFPYKWDKIFTNNQWINMD